MLRKKIACFLLAVTTMLQPMVAAAADLDSAFSSLLGPGATVSANAPGRYQSSARTGFSAGSVDIRVPRAPTVPNLFSVTPPKIEAGCNGISAHFGGFSFISGKEFEAMVKKIASGYALGFVSGVVMKALCPICHDVVQQLKTAAQHASRLARDSCQWGFEDGKNWAEKGLFSSEAGTNQCRSLGAQAGAGEDTGSSSLYSSFCNSMRTVASSLKDFNTELAKNDPNATPEGIREKTMCDTGIGGNTTWHRLKAMDASGVFESGSGDNYNRKLILLNILGAELTVAAASDGTPKCELPAGIKEPGEKGAYCPPPLDAERLVAYFMCGGKDTWSNSGTSSRVRSYCGDMFKPNSTNTDARVWKCKGNEREKCMHLELRPADELFNGTGFLVSINTLLRTAVQRVRANEALVKNNGSDTEGQNIIKLIQVAPFPLYQAINAAAVYPAGAEDLMDSISILVAEQFAYAYFDEVTRLRGRSASGTCISPNQASAMLEFLEKFRATNFARKQLIAQNMNIQQGLNEQIRQLNLAIQRQVMSSGMLGSTRMADAVNSSVTGVVNNGNGAAAAPAP